MCSSDLVTVSSATSLTVNVTIDAAATTGVRSLTVTNVDKGTATLASGLTVNAGPTVTSMTPSALGRGASAQTMTIVGTGFVAGATVAISATGVTLGTATITATQITIPVTVSATATLGAADIRVTNPDAGSIVVTGGLTIVAAQTITSVSPAVLGGGATAQTVTINGTNFVAGAVVAFSGTGVTAGAATIVNSTQMLVSVTVAATATAGLRNVTVTSGGLVATLTNGFTVTAAPTVTSVTPASRGQGATNQNLVVAGTGFQAGITPVFSGTGVTVNSVTVTSATSLTVNVTVGAAGTRDRKSTRLNSSHVALSRMPSSA